MGPSTLKKNWNENGHTLLLSPPRFSQLWMAGMDCEAGAQTARKKKGKVVLIVIVLPCAVHKPLSRVKKPTVELEGVITTVQRSQ